MSIYMTEEEQLYALKQWWKKYNSLITIVASLLLLAIAGYKYWYWHQDKVNLQASAAYERMILATANHDNALIQSYANQLISEYSATVYAIPARFVLAKLYVEMAQYSKAIFMLEFVMQHAKINAFKQVAQLRIARLLIQGKQYTEALNILAQVNDATYLPVINELKGDIFAALNKRQQAINSYQAAITAMQHNGISNPFLEMKANEIQV